MNVQPSGTKHTEFFRIRTSEINQQKTVHPHSLIGLMQEASMQHTISMKVSVWDMEKLNASWVLLRMQVKFHKYPGLNETVRIDTYPCGMDGYFTNRDFLAYDEAGNLCATIASMWTLISLETRKMIKIPLDYHTLVYPAPSTLGKPEINIPAVTDHSSPTSVVINYFHLDWNGHVNNVQLIKIVLETMENEWLVANMPVQMDLQFKNEVLCGQEVRVSHQKTGELSYTHAVRHGESGREIMLASTIWQKK